MQKGIRLRALSTFLPRIISFARSAKSILCSGVRLHHNALAGCLVKDEIATGRRISELLYAFLGRFNGCHSAAPKYAAGFDPENVEIRNHSRPPPDLGYLIL